MTKKIYGFLFLFLCAFSGVVTAQNTVGTLIYDGSQAMDGYNLTFPHRQHNTYLLDNCGRIVNWWGDTINNPGNSVILMNNGDIIRACGRGAASNSLIHAGGGGELVERRDWDNNLLWQYTINDSTERMHHDIAVKPNGNILAIVWESISYQDAVDQGRDPGLLPDSVLWPDKVVEIEPSGTNGGTIVWEWHAWDHLVQDYDSTKPNWGVVGQHPELINVNHDDGAGEADWHHMNAIDYNADLQQIALSVPAFNEIWIIDQSTTTAQSSGHAGGLGGRGGDLLYRWGNPAAYDQGDTTDQQLFYQHDVHWIDQQLSQGDDPDFGKLMIFNNRKGGNTYSSVVVIDPAFEMYNWTYPYNMTTGFSPVTYDWEYTAPNPTDMHSTGLSGAQRLKNGNTLICVGRFGRSFEINPNNEIVWEYVTPINMGQIATQGDTLTINQNLTFRLNRYGTDFPGFTGRDMTPGDYLELNPDTTVCANSVGRPEPIEAVGLNLYPNPTTGQFVIEHKATRTLGYVIVDLVGREVLQGAASPGKNAVDLSSLENGVYLVRMESGESRKLVVSK